MPSILVAGLINIETTLAVEQFPVVYEPVRYPFFGVNTSVSGVGYNIVKALNTLGNEVRFLSLIGDDSAGQLVRQDLASLQIDDQQILSQLEHTPQSVILYDSSGNRAIYTDLKDIQDQSYPQAVFKTTLSQCSLAVLCNINFTRPMLTQARQAGITVATDVHAISSIDDSYNADYMRNADILFQSHERLPCSSEDWVRQLWQVYGTSIAVVGLGSEGALLAVRDHNFIERIPAVFTRPIVNTIGAGDALFSAFIHTYLHTNNPYTAIQKAMIFASYKIGVRGAADGFLTARDLDDWHIRLVEKH
ncbi:MAG TPA: carbohydrate kinase family protein [Phototrophicaceae bacterium]|jgi:ribokinase|nr:carbohydrate kinase family protein [Phototrophicaceae bacterium]